MAKSFETTAEYLSTEALEKHAWEKFQPKLAALTSLAEMKALLEQAPPLGTPSYKFYANLAGFMITFRPPKDVNDTERELYAQLRERLKAAGALDGP